MNIPREIEKLAEGSPFRRVNAGELACCEAWLATAPRPALQRKFLRRGDVISTVHVPQDVEYQAAYRRVELLVAYNRCLASTDESRVDTVGSAEVRDWLLSKARAGAAACSLRAWADAFAVEHDGRRPSHTTIAAVLAGTPALQPLRLRESKAARPPAHRLTDAELAGLAAGGRAPEEEAAIRDIQENLPEREEAILKKLKGKTHESQRREFRRELKRKPARKRAELLYLIECHLLDEASEGRPIPPRA